ncbi:MAG: hypothetical protein A2189_00390, partial [Paenibacillus sp. RIFOXYA1_FULL_44_5]
MNRCERIGMIDIGSNSIRLVIYEKVGKSANRVLDESKASARLSEKVGVDKILAHEDIMSIVQILLHFKGLCEAQEVQVIRAVATAAIRNAENYDEIIQTLHVHTGLQIEILSGKEEARLGFLGAINTLDLNTGLLIDIGGWSTEITYFQDREIVHSVSIPLGAVNVTKRYTKNGNAKPAEIVKIQQMMTEALENELWIKQCQGLPLIGMGGTIRTLAKIDQKQKKYSFPAIHNYSLLPHEGEEILHRIASMNVGKRKKITGLASDRADIIAAGLILLQTIMTYTSVSNLIVSGSGLREGLFYEMANPENPKLAHVLQDSVDNLLLLHPSVPRKHVEQVNRLAKRIFDAGFSQLNLQATDEQAKLYLGVAAKLYRIGVTVDYYHYDQHTYYLMENSRLNGLTHREIVLCALIASYRSRGRTRQLFNEH